jgi:hypothetical protein
MYRQIMRREPASDAFVLQVRVKSVSKQLAFLE